MATLSLDVVPCKSFSKRIGRFSFAEFEAWHLNNGSATLRLLREMDHNVSAARVREREAFNSPRSSTRS